MIKKVNLLIESSEGVNYLINGLMDDEHVQFKQMCYNIEESEDGIEVVVKPGVELVFEVDDEKEFNTKLQKIMDEIYLGI